MFLVIRKCCLGPNCSYNHGTPAGKDARHLVAQYITDNKAMANKVARNFAAYDGEAVDLSINPEVLDTITQRSRHWVQEQIDLNLVPDRAPNE